MFIANSVIPQTPCLHYVMNYYIKQTLIKCSIHNAVHHLLMILAKSHICTLGTAKLVEAERNVRRRRRVDSICRAKSRQSRAFCKFATLYHFA